MLSLSIIASVSVLIVASFSAFIAFLNYKAIMSCSLYMEAVTMGPNPSTHIRMSNIDRIDKTLMLNNINPAATASPGIYLSYFDIYLGNAGPGLAKNVRWEVDYCSQGGCNDIGSMKGEEEVFGPQAKKLIVGYLIREIRNPSNMLSNSNLKLPNKNGKFPWVISLEYSKPGINLIKKKINETYEINEKGVVKKSSKSSIKIKSP